MERFPITLWPSSPLLPLARVGYADVDEGACEFLPTDWIWFQLADADLDTESGVQALLKPFLGPPPPPWPRDGNWEWLVPVDRRHLLGSADPDRPWLGGPEDTRWRLKSLRAIVRTWDAEHRKADSLEPWIDEGFDLSARWIGPDRRRFAWSLASGMLNDGLSAFPHVRPRFDAFGDGTSIEDVAELGLFDVFSAACQQVFNNMIEGETLRRCENATCGRTFVHQQGGEKWHRTKGLLYCSEKCQKAEAQRRYRRRQKQAGREEPGLE